LKIEEILYCVINQMFAGLKKLKLTPP
jgi:hypothetical protein